MASLEPPNIVIDPDKNRAKKLVEFLGGGYTEDSLEKFLSPDSGKHPALNFLFPSPLIMIAKGKDEDLIYEYLGHYLYCNIFFYNPEIHPEIIAKNVEYWLELYKTNKETDTPVPKPPESIHVIVVFRDIPAYE